MVTHATGSEQTTGNGKRSINRLKNSKKNFENEVANHERSFLRSLTSSGLPLEIGCFEELSNQTKTHLKTTLARYENRKTAGNREK